MNDILHDILSRLPAMCLLRSRAVCKAWKLIIDDPYFVKSYTKNCQHSSTILIRNGRGGGLSSFSLDRLTYADGDQQIDVTRIKQIIHRGVPRLGDLPAHSCNGLILISHHATAKSWVIWNPLVQDFHVLPPPSIDDSLSEHGLMRTGFGYDEAADDYKVIRVHKLHGGEGYRSLVYSLKSSHCWRVIQGFPGDTCLGEKGVFLKGALHWRSREGIIALRVGKEDHVVLPRPPTIGTCWEGLDALDGCLIFSYGHYNQMGIDGWVMNDYGKSWTKLFSVKSDVVGLRVVAYLKSQGQVFLRHYGNGLVWIDLLTNSAKKVTISGLPHNYSTFSQFCPESIVRLDTSSTRAARVNMKRKRNEEGKRAYKRFENTIPSSYYYLFISNYKFDGFHDPT